MKKRMKFKIIIGIAIVILIALVVFVLAVNKLTPCKDEPDHFIDESGNGYCIARELVDDLAAVSDESNIENIKSSLPA